MEEVLSPIGNGRSITLSVLGQTRNQTEFSYATITTPCEGITHPKLAGSKIRLQSHKYT